jgi:predicted ATPase/class 3 adenylate cyclase
MAGELPMSDIISLGLWIKRRRKALDLTQDELAQRVGCSLNLIQKIEADARRPSREIAALLADTLELAADEQAPFIQAARVELGADRLAPPAQSVARGAFVPTPALASQPVPTATPAIALPSGTVTFLFTDIEGSTQLWEQHPQAMPAAIERHNAILSAAIARHGGVVFKLVGDAVYAAFASAPEALAAALSAQRALHAEAWGATGLLRVRMALHTGSAAARDGDYLGLPLSRVARLLAAGHGGQILLSLATQELLRDQLPDDTALRDLGVYRLKDLARPESIFQVVVPDLPADFPPLNTPGIRRTNLPTSPTPLIGREHELAQLGALLHQPDTRLLTLTGPGGIGKTRLALELAGAVLEQFLDGVWLVELAALADPALIVPTIAAVLELREDPGRPLLTTLTTYLRERQPLLILDNCEHLIDACAQMSSTLLQACPRLRLLASSREPLGVAGEAFFRVPALAAPDPHQLPPLDQLMRYPAVQLFVERARTVQPAFIVTEVNAAPLAQVCARLDGIPLAIELAAARVRMLSLAQIAARLDDRFHLLTGGARSALPRQQTLQALIDWSYDLLPEDERALLRRLAVFVGGWTLEAAEAVCTLSIEHEELRQAVDDRVVLNSQFSILDLLGHLVDKSLVEAEPGEEIARYRMLETIRHYALEKLAASGEADALRRRHATYFRDTAQSYISRAESVRGNRPESENLRAALAWSQSAAGDPALALDLAVPVAWVEFNRGDYQGARRLLAQALEYAEGLIDTLRYAEVSGSLGYIISRMGDLAGGRALAEQSYTLYQKLGGKPGEASALELLGWMAREQGDAATARGLLEQGVALNRELGDKGQLIYALVHLAEVAVLEEDAASAETLLEESLALNRESYDQQSFGWSLNHLGHAAQLHGDYERAAQLHAESLALFIDLAGEKNAGVMWDWQSLGETALAQGDLVAARGWLAAALRLCDELGDPVMIAWCLAGLGSAAALDEEPERAARLWGAAERLRAALGCRPAPAARATYERAVALARAQLGEEVFAAEWEAGGALTLEQTIAEALAPI